MSTYLNTIPNILLLDIAGMPKAWINYEKAAYYKTKGLIAFEPEEAGWTLRGGTNRITCEQSTLDIKTIIAITAKPNERERRVSLPTQRTLFRRDHNRCCYCGHTFTKSKLEMEHIIPASKGGKNSWMNLVTACGGCNDYKKDRTPKEADMNMYYQPYTPCKAEHLVLSNSQLTEDQLAYLQQFIKNEESRWHSNFDLETWN